jgi:hypothetical protein
VKAAPLFRIRSSSSSPIVGKGVSSMLRRVLARFRAERRLRNRLGLERGELVLARIRNETGLQAIATERAVYHRNGSQTPTGDGWARLGWEQVQDVRTDGLLTVGQQPVPLPAHDGWLALARERVAWTVLASVPIRLAGRDVGRVTARRQPGSDRLGWDVALVAGVCPDHGEVRTALDAAIGRLRAELGRST